MKVCNICYFLTAPQPWVKRWWKYSRGAENRWKKDVEEMFKMGEDSLEKFVVVNSAAGEGNE
jgi:hypothetical protein